MEYQIIFSAGYENDDFYLMKDLCCDVLIQDAAGNYFNPQFLTLDRLNGEFKSDQICYFEDNLVILREVTQENILKCIPDLHKKMFYKKWLPLTNEQLEKYFYPKTDWVVYDVNI